MSAAEISEALGLTSLKSRTWSIFKTSAKQGTGLEEGMDWYVMRELAASSGALPVFGGRRKRKLSLSFREPLSRYVMGPCLPGVELCLSWVGEAKGKLSLNFREPLSRSLRAVMRYFSVACLCLGFVGEEARRRCFLCAHRAPAFVRVPCWCLGFKAGAQLLKL